MLASHRRAFGALLTSAIVLAAAIPASAIEPFGSLQWGNQAVRGDMAPPIVTANSARVAFIERAADLSHPDLRGSDELTMSGDAAISGFHATAVMSVAAALRNGIGIEGLWPGMRAVSVGSDLSCDASARAIRSAIRAGVRVINMSYTGSSCVTHRLALEEATAANVVLVAASGNTGDQGAGNSSARFPASADHVIGVGSFGRGGGTSALNDPAGTIDLLAPGESIAAAVPISTPQTRLPAGWDYENGTSFAAPFVSTAAAWLASARPELSAAQISELLIATAIPADARFTLPQRAAGWGRIDLSAALREAAPLDDKFEPNDSIQVLSRKLAKPVGRVNPLNLRSGTALTATLRARQDERDIYRLTLRRGERVRLSVRTKNGELAIRVLHGHATSDSSARPLLARAGATRGRAAKVDIAASGLRTRSAYVSVIRRGLPERRAISYKLKLTRKGR